MLKDLTTTQPYGTDSNLPISVANLKVRLRISGTSEDDFIKDCIRTASILLEKFTGRSFVEQTHLLTLDQLSAEFGATDLFLGSRAIIYLGRPPLISVTSLTFFDSDGTSSVVDAADYYVDLKNGRIMPLPGVTWQTDQRNINAVEVEYVAGYVADTAGATLDPDIITAVAMMAGYLYENRLGECDIPPGVRKVIRSRKLIRLGKPYMGLEFNKVTIRSGSLPGGY